MVFLSESFDAEDTRPPGPADTLEAAASIWESAVDMVLARMPARMAPASSARITEWVLMKLARRTMTLSAAEADSKPWIAPAREAAKPTTPMAMATNMDTATQPVPTRRETLQLIGVGNGHEPQKDMGHTEVAQAPGHGGDDGQHRIGTGLAGDQRWRFWSGPR